MSGYIAASCRRRRSRSCLVSSAIGNLTKRAESGRPTRPVSVAPMTIVGTADWSLMGASNGSLKLNGATRAEVVSLLNAPANVTLSAWAYLTGADSSGAEIVSLGDYFAMRLNEGSSSRALFYDGSSWVSAAVNQTFANTGWHHFAAVFNDTADTCKFYVDAVEVASVSTTASLPYAGLGNKTVIGAHGNSGTNWDFTGRIDDVRVYSRALCPGEITRLKAGGNPFEGVRLSSGSKSSKVES